MKIHIINGGNFELDGGAMFGIVPKNMWNRMNPANDNNMCSWSLRSILIEVNDRKILVDTGMGDKQDPIFFSRYNPTNTNGIIDTLKSKGFDPSEITDVFLTHLHFDHCGGTVGKNEDGSFFLNFPNATHWTNKVHWDWSMNPNPREAGSFLKENILPIQELGKLEFIPVTENDYEWIEGIKIRFVYGHTEAMMMLFIPFEGSQLVYCADLIPSSHHLGLPYVMSYDLRPLDTIKEKDRLLKEAIDNDYYLFYEHDPVVAYSKIGKNEKGKIVPLDPVKDV